MKILIADDSPFILSFLEEVLKGDGNDVKAVKNGIEALESIFYEPPDIAILDVIMPYMTGYQVVRVLKSDPITKDIPVILLTSKGDQADKFWGKHVGAEYYIVKDDDIENILRNIKEVISKVEKRINKKVTKPKIKRKYSPLNILSKVNDMLDRKLYELVIMNKIGNLVSRISNFEILCKEFVSFFRQIFDFSILSVVIDSEEGAVAITFIEKKISEEKYEDFKREIMRFVFTGSNEENKITKEFVFGDENIIKKSVKPSYGEILNYKVKDDGKVVGVIAMATEEEKFFSRDEKERFEQIAAYSFLVIHSAFLYKKVRELSIYDGLTEIYNRRYIMELLVKEFRVALRYKRPFSIIMIDIDHFKKVNDTFGHQMGDTVLKEVSYVIKSALRDVDDVGRYGGEEFLVILPNTDLEGARNLSERLRESVENHKIPGAPDELKVTISLGYASYPESNANTYSELIKIADCGLYRAKEKGRNRVEYCGEKDR